MRLMPKRKDNQAAARAILEKVKNPGEQSRLIAVLEKIYDDYHAFGEQQDMMEHKLDEVRTDIKEIKLRLDRLDGRVAAIKLRLDKLEIKVEGILREVREIKREVIELRHQKASKSQLHTLETRVAKLERQVPV